MVELDDTLKPGDGDPSETGSDTIPTASLVVVDADFTELQESNRDHYEIGEEIARGGMGRIVAARDRRAGRPIVIKEVRSDLMMVIDDAAREVLVRRFKREAMLTARLQHPAVVPVYEIGRFGDTPFIAMKRVEGTPLLQLLEDADSLADRLALLPRIIAVAEAIAYAHSEGVIHRDIKPANILIGSFGETVVIDWGLAKLVSESDEAFDSIPPVPNDLETVAGSVFGTPSYMPPEQASGEEVGPAADVYALGAILYHTLCGAAPYVADKATDTAISLIDLVRAGPPIPIPELSEDAPTDLVSVAAKAMARDPTARYSAAELVDELRSFQRGQQVGVHHYTVRELVRRWVGRHRALVLTAITLTLAGAMATGWFVAETIAARDRADRETQLATTRLEEAMERTWERGRRELEIGNGRQALRALAAAYRHLEHPLLARHLGEALRGVNGFIRQVADVGEPVITLGLRGDAKRIVAIVNREVTLYDDRGNVLLRTRGSTTTFTGNKLVIIDRSGVMSVWSSDTGATVGQIHSGYAPEGLVAASGGLVAVSVNGILRVFRLDPLELVYEREAKAMGPLSFSTGGERLLSVNLLPTIFGRGGEVVFRGTEFKIGRSGGLSPDGTQFVKSDKGGMAIYSDDGSLLGRIPGIEVRSAVYSADGTKLLFRDGLNNVCVWSFAEASRRCLGSVSNASLAYNPSFERIALGKANGDVVVRSVVGDVRAVVAASDLDRPMVRLSTDGKRMVTAGDDGKIRLWNIERPIFDDKIDHAGPDRESEFAEGLVVVSSERVLRVWDPDRPSAPILELNSEGGRGLESALAGTSIAWAGKCWDLGSGRPIADFEVWSGLSIVRLDPRGQVVVGRDGARIVALDCRTGAVRWTLDLERELPEINVNHEHLPLMLWVGTRDRMMVQSIGRDLLVDLESGEVVRKFVRESNAISFAGVFYGEHGFASAEGRQVFFTDLESGETTSTAGLGRGLAVHPDGHRLLIPREASALLRDTRTGAEVAIPLRSQRRAGTAFSRDGLLLALGRDTGWIDLYELGGARWIGDRYVGAGAFRTSFSRKGRLVVTSLDRTLIFDLPVETRSPDQVDAEVTRVLGESP